MERTLIILKPDAYRRRLVGEITARLERKGLLLVACKMMSLEQETLREHYAHLVDKPYYPRIARFMMRTPVIVQCWAGVEAVAVVREIAGVTNGRKALPGTIRGDFSVSVQCNLVHASDSTQAAETEIGRFFSPAEVFSVEDAQEDIFYASGESG